MEDKKSVKNLKKIDYIVLFIILIGIGFVFATTSMTAPVIYGNYSTLIVNITVDANGANNMTNITCYYNSSGGAATEWLMNITNTTSYQTEFANTSISVTDFSETTTYNISCDISNGTTLNQTISVANITIDYTAPNVSSFYTTTDNGNYSGSALVLNASVSDATAGMDSVYFNITYPNGSQLNFTKASSPTADYYNISLDTTGFTDGKYNITVYSNDTINNQNNSEQISVTLDTTAPTVSLSKSSSTKNSLTIDITASDATSGLNGICTVSRSGASVSGTTSLTESGLSCGTSYSYIVTCYDHASNSGSSSSTSFSTDACSGGSSLSDSDLAALKAKTYIISEAQFTEGYSKQLAKYDKIKVPVGTEKHIVEINEVSAEKVTIKISSTPQEATLVIGDERKFDVTNDGYYDIYVKLNSIADNKANVSIKSIYEKISEASKSEEQKKEQEAVSGADETITETGNAKLWWIIGIVVVLVLAGIGYGVKKKRD